MHSYSVDLKAKDTLLTSWAHMLSVNDLLHQTTASTSDAILAKKSTRLESDKCIRYQSRSCYSQEKSVPGSCIGKQSLHRASA
jgi:hypothetical protein